MIPGGAGTPVFPGKGAPAPGARGPDAFVLRERAAEGTALCIFPLRPFLLFLPAAIHPSFFPPRVTPGRHPLPLSRLSIRPPVLSSGHPAVHPSSCPSSLLSSSLSLQRPPFPWSRSRQCPTRALIPGPSSRGRAPTPISSTAPALLSDRPSLGILPESLSRESFQSIVPGNCSRTACLPQSFSPPATRLPSVLPSCGTVAQLSVDKAQGAFLPLAEGKASFLLQSHLF